MFSCECWSGTPKRMPTFRYVQGVELVERRRKKRRQLQKELKKRTKMNARRMKTSQMLHKSPENVNSISPASLLSSPHKAQSTRSSHSRDSTESCHWNN